MGEKVLEVYQGNDWITYRWSVAQAFDTLDRLRDLCHHAPALTNVLSQAIGGGAPRYEITDDGAMNVFGGLVELCDDLSGELDAAQADLSPYLQNDVSQRWLGFEMRLHLNEMRQTALHEYQSPDPSNAVIDTISNLATRIGDLLKQIDQ